MRDTEYPCILWRSQVSALWWRVGWVLAENYMQGYFADPRWMKQAALENKIFAHLAGFLLSFMLLSIWNGSTGLLLTLHAFGQNLQPVNFWSKSSFEVASTSLFRCTTTSSRCVRYAKSLSLYFFSKILIYIFFHKICFVAIVLC